MGYGHLDDSATCPRCTGSGWTACHCGGDQCYCDNHGTMDCPYCLGEGLVSNAQFDRYFAAQSKFHDAMLQARKDTQ